MSYKNSIEQLIINNQRRLQKLKEQKASFGLDTPPHILTEIEDIETEVDNLRIELEKNPIQIEEDVKRPKPNIRVTRGN